MKPRNMFQRHRVAATAAVIAAGLLATLSGSALAEEKAKSGEVVHHFYIHFPEGDASGVVDVSVTVTNNDTAPKPVLSTVPTGDAEPAATAQFDAGAFDPTTPAAQSTEDDPAAATPVEKPEESAGPLNGEAPETAPEDWQVLRESNEAASSVPEESDVIGIIDLAGDSGSDTVTKEKPQGSLMGLLLFTFVLAIFLGFELISKVPSQLHTPLMSGSNAISGITVVGAIMAAGSGGGFLLTVLGTLAVIFATINVVGGYLVTDRMLGMFKHKDGS